MTYVGKSPEAFDDIGKWNLAHDGRTLQLQGGREAPVQFQIADHATLRKLDPAGKPIASQFNYDLKRQSVFAPIEPALRMRGAYAYMADAGAFTECLTGKRMPVAQERDNAALEAAYSKSRATPGGALLATVDGRIAMRMPMEGSGPRPTLIVERFHSRVGQVRSSALNCVSREHPLETHAAGNRRRDSRESAARAVPHSAI